MRVVRWCLLEWWLLVSVAGDGILQLAEDLLPGGGFGQPNLLMEMGGIIYESAVTSSTGTELFRFDGGSQTLVKDIQSGATGSGITFISVFNATHFFLSANDGVNGIELWISDGTTGGTTLFANMDGTSSSSSPSAPVVNSTTHTFYFSATVSGNKQIYHTDGNTFPTLLGGGIPGLSNPGTNAMIEYNGILLFNAPSASGANNQLWAWNGTDFYILKTICPNCISSVGGLTNCGNGVLFTATNITINGNLEPWFTDGTSAGTYQLLEVNNGGSAGVSSIVYDGVRYCYFTATDGPTNHGSELWRTDLTDSGTVMVADLNPGTASSSPVRSRLDPYNGLVYFYATVPGASHLYSVNSSGIIIQEESLSLINNVYIRAYSVDRNVYLSTENANGTYGQELYRFIPSCNSVICSNGGTCVEQAVGQGNFCSCAAGYSGTTCQTDINECSSAPCLNGATCNDGANSFTCICPSGYSGTLCAGEPLFFFFASFFFFLSLCER